jgi:hypothetical protein
MVMLEVLKQALEALESCDWHDSISGEYQFYDSDLVENSITSLHQAIANLEKHEPVAWMYWLHNPVRVFLNKDEAMLELYRLNREYPADSDSRQMKPLYTSPQPKEWVGLTEEEVAEIERNSLHRSQAIRAIETKLKEKNGIKE